MGMTYSLVNVTIGLIGKDLKKRIELGFITGISLFGISFIIGLTIFFQTGSIDWISKTYSVMFITAIITILAVLTLTVVMVFSRKSEYTSMQRKAIGPFAALYLSKYILLCSELMLPKQIGLYVGTFILILSNFIPLFWLKNYFIKYYVAFDSSKTESTLGILSREYDISRREREIIGLILKGKSNKEIKDILCISFSTVKNHIYNVYQKIGINSRSQLMHMVMEFPDNRDAQGS
jgi:DNA-binding CsgD family transcriptional regulator